MESKSKMEIHLHNSAIGILNTGEIDEVNSITVSVSSLVDAGQSEMAQALKELTEAVANNQDIESRHRSDLLDNLEELSRQAALKPDERAKPGIIKSLCAGTAASLSATASLAQVWSTWGNTIRAFFGF